MSRTLAYRFTQGLACNNRGLGKPNEDYIATGGDGQIFILLDGVTRPHAEYDGSGSSAAIDVCEVFAASLLERQEDILRAEGTRATQEALALAVTQANEAVARYRSAKPPEQWRFYPAAVGIAAVIKQDVMSFAYVGDCMGVLYRDNARMVFAEQQTIHATKIMKLPKERLYGEACNHPESRYAYGVINGDDEMAKLLRVSHISLERGDTVYLVSDGMQKFITLEDLSAWQTATAQEMIDASCGYDVPPYASYADDKAMIKIVFE
ncbi:MAG: protein phosphatase 2C domain-containing protein [Clostridia bacterium]|nr:protein phosphatase 2C domain-containing protein [Clostridia bacterium]